MIAFDDIRKAQLKQKNEQMFTKKAIVQEKRMLPETGFALMHP